MPANKTINYNEVNNIKLVEQFLTDANFYNRASGLYSTIICNVKVACEKLDDIEDDLEVEFKENDNIGKISLKLSGRITGDDGYPINYYPKGLVYSLEGSSFVITGSTRRAGKYKCTITPK